MPGVRIGRGSLVGDIAFTLGCTSWKRTLTVVEELSLSWIYVLAKSNFWTSAFQSWSKIVVSGLATRPDEEYFVASGLNNSRRDPNVLEDLTNKRFTSNIDYQSAFLLITQSTYY